MVFSKQDRLTDLIEFTLPLLITAGIAWWTISAKGYWFVDDAFISFRYVKNLAAGLGLTWNPGTPVEGYTNLLWVLLLTPFSWLGLDLVRPAVILGTLFQLGTVDLIRRITRRCWPHRSPWLRMLAPCLVATHLQCAFWTVSGMETPMFGFWVLLAVHLAIRSRNKQGSPWLLGGACAAACLTRPEGLMVSGLILIAEQLCAWRRAPSGERWTALKQRTRELLPAALIVGGVVGIHLAFRLIYYGYPLPNTFYAKVALGEVALQRGKAHLWGFFTEAGGLYTLPGFVLLFLGRRTGPSRAAIGLILVAKRAVASRIGRMRSEQRSNTCGIASSVATSPLDAGRKCALQQGIQTGRRSKVTAPPDHRGASPSPDAPPIVAADERDYLFHGFLLWAVYLLYLLMIGGDLPGWYRFYLPLLPLPLIGLTGLFLRFADALWPRPGPPRPRALRTSVLVFSLCAILSGQQLFTAPSALRNIHIVHDLRDLSFAIALLLKNQVPDSALLAIDAVGVFGYYMPNRIIDFWGLNDPVIAHRKIPPSAHSRFAHDKFDLYYTLSLHPDFIIVFLPIDPLKGYELCWPSTVLPRMRLLRRSYPLLEDQRGLGMPPGERRDLRLPPPCNAPLKGPPALDLF